MKLLRTHANATRAASYQRYFKEPVNYFGLDNETAQRIKGDLFDRVRETWSIQDAVRYCNAMVNVDYSVSIFQRRTRQKVGRRKTFDIKKAPDTSPGAKHPCYEIFQIDFIRQRLGA